VTGIEWVRDEIHIRDARRDRSAGNVRHDIVDRGASCNNGCVIRFYDFPHFPTLRFLTTWPVKALLSSFLDLAM
jgi:hypothetical protein